MQALFGKAVLALLLTASGLCLAAQPEPAALPEQRVATAMPEIAGATIHVLAGDNFQAALDRAQPGDVIELEAGATFRGSFTLPKKSGNDWIVIRSAAMDRLPEPGVRAEPAHAAAMPVLAGKRGSAVLRAAPGAHHYRLVGIEIRPQPGNFLYTLVELGNGTEQLADQPHHLIFDRCYLHGDPARGTRRGIALNSAHTAVINSWLADFKEVGSDSQALAGWNGAGPFLIGNNYLEAAGENIMFGGATPAINGLVPADIEIRGNYLTKSLTWKADNPSYAGTPWTVKNLFELKNARRVLVEGNVLEHNWAQSQNGIAVLLTVRNEGGAAPWAVVEDVTFANNLVIRIAGGVNILGQDDNGKPSGRTERIVIRNNLFQDMGGKWGQGPLFQLLQATSDIAIDRNTALNGASIIVTEGGPHSNLRFSRNIVNHNEYGIIGTGTPTGTPTLERYFPDATLEHNFIVGGATNNYPGGNFFPASETDVGFLDQDIGDFRLDPARTLRRGETNETGADLQALCAALAPPEHSRYCDLSARRAAR